MFLLLIFFYFGLSSAIAFSKTKLFYVYQIGGHLLEEKTMENTYPHINQKVAKAT